MAIKTSLSPGTNPGRDALLPHHRGSEFRVSNTLPLVSNTHQGVSSTLPSVSDTHQGVSNTLPSVSNTHQGVPNTIPSVSNTHQGVSNTLHRVSSTDLSSTPTLAHRSREMARRRGARWRSSSACASTRCPRVRHTKKRVGHTLMCLEACWTHPGLCRVRKRQPP